ncbi:hypothetical protein LTR70_010291 [Exophiala xenobiotica]|uniref:Auxiliary Activity family 9 catalytic domain-containing protein n=1 Tax=Lithohypha guttulata TaxID=1690604 RepID=A0ABR0JUP8_9EURO|nr:hypothetical protein LTR24_010283 [Lithohypha guttulata]KAK5309432.1 hypothetical protein LTR70_010291 [Exophiala xenobiotica]
MTDTPGSLLTRLLAHGLLISQVAAHGYVQGIVADGVFYQGYRPSFQYSSQNLSLAGWSDPKNINNGFINDYTSPDIICHWDATPGQAYAEVHAGGTVELQWTPWPVGHLGPVISYLANCNGECTNVDKTSLLFNKVDAVGLVQGGPSPGTWAASELVANNNSWTLTIPSSIAPGNYNYPQCVNLKVTGIGTNSLQSGTLGTQLYNTADPGLHIDIYQALSNYTVPGPPLLARAGNGTSSNSTVTTTVRFPNTTVTTATATAFGGYFDTRPVTAVANATTTTSTLLNATTTTSTAAVAAATTFAGAAAGFFEVVSSTTSSTAFSFATPTTFQTLTSGRLPVPFTYVGAYGEVTVTVTPIRYRTFNTTSWPTPTATWTATGYPFDIGTWNSTNTTTTTVAPTSTGTGGLCIANADACYNLTNSSNRSIVVNGTVTITGTAAPTGTGLFNVTTVIGGPAIDNGYRSKLRRRSLLRRLPQ